MRVTQIWSRPWIWILFAASIFVPFVIIGAAYRCPFHGDILEANRRSVREWGKSGSGDAIASFHVWSDDPAGKGMAKFLLDISAQPTSWTSGGIGPAVSCIEQASLPLFRKLAQVTEGRRQHGFDFTRVQVAQLCRHLAAAYASARNWGHAADRLLLGVQCVDSQGRSWAAQAKWNALVTRANWYAACDLMLGLKPDTTATRSIASAVRRIRETDPRWRPDAESGQMPVWYTSFGTDTETNELREPSPAERVLQFWTSGLGLQPLVGSTQRALASEARLLHPDPAKRQWAEQYLASGEENEWSIVPWNYMLRIKRARWLLDGAPNLLPNVLAGQGAFKGLDPLAVAFYVYHWSMTHDYRAELFAHVPAQSWLIEAACAVRLFRLEQGRWPKDIRELAPQYLPDLPAGYVDPAKMPVVATVLDVTSAPLGTIRMGMLEMTRDRLLSYLRLDSKFDLLNAATGQHEVNLGATDGNRAVDGARIFSLVASTSSTKTFRVTLNDSRQGDWPLMADEIERLNPDVQTSATIWGTVSSTQHPDLFGTAPSCQCGTMAVDRQLLRQAAQAGMARRVQKALRENGMSTCTLSVPDVPWSSGTPYRTVIDMTVPRHVFAVWIDGFDPAELAQRPPDQPALNLSDATRQGVRAMVAATPNKQLIAYPGE